MSDFGAVPAMSGSPGAPAPQPEVPAAESENAPFGNPMPADPAGGFAGRTTDELDEAEKFLPEPILWKPRLTTNPNGQLNIPVQLPQQPGRYRLLIDAHGSGRLGTVVRYVEVLPPKLAAPVPAPTKKASN